MKEIRKMKIGDMNFNSFTISEYTTNQLFDVVVDKGEKVVTSVS